MSPADLYRIVYAAGLSVRIDGDGLVFKPAARLTPELRALLIRDKLAPIAFLQEAEVTAAELAEAAVRCCDHFGDGDADREQMRRECLATPAHLRRDLLMHFVMSYPFKPTAKEGRGGGIDPVSSQLP